MKYTLIHSYRVDPTPGEWASYGFGDYAKMEVDDVDTVEADDIRSAQRAFKKKWIHARFGGKFANWHVVESNSLHHTHF